ncbi:putative hydrolase RNJ42_00731 [Nakaseomyces bracarensis]|uniref:putative hydrolase n=1 Tax=Nakaseomyces bracarensis TaxID=273131 RepID=UPI00387180B4
MNPKDTNISVASNCYNNVLTKMKSASSMKGLEVRDIVSLAFHHVKPRIHRAHPPPWKEKPAIINLHGLFGSHIMYHSLNRLMVQKFETDIYSLDLRNHGNSPRAAPYDYVTLTNDVIQFVRNNIYNETPGRPLYLTGFSLGGRVALLATLSRLLNVQKCISIDLPPYTIPELDKHFTGNCDLVNRIANREIKIERGSDNWKDNVLAMFKELPVNDSTSGQNLALYFANGFLSVKANHDKSLSSRDDYIDYATPVHWMPDLAEEVKRWPERKELNPMMYRYQSEVPTLFMKGLQSEFIKRDYSLLKEHFPNSEVKEFNCGHNILMDFPKESFDTIIEFFSRKQHKQH